MKEKILRAFCWSGCIFMIALSHWLRSRMFIHPDLAYGLILAHKMMQGERYYYDFFEFNLPLLFSLIVRIPVFLAQTLSLPEIPVFHAFVTLSGVACLLACANVLKGSIAYNDKAMYYNIILAACLVLFLPFPSLGLSVVGDKVFFLLALTLPYFFSCLPRGQALSGKQILLIGIMAGLGFCLKPHYAALWLMLECYTLFTRKDAWAERARISACVLSTALAYLVWLYLCVPEYWQLIYPMLKYLYIPADPLLFAARMLLSKAMWAVPVLYFIIIRRVSGRSATILRFLFFGFIATYAERLLERHFTAAGVGALSAFATLLTFPLALECLRGRRLYGPLQSAVCFILLTGLFLNYPAEQVRTAYAGGTVPERILMERLLPYVNKYADNKSFLILDPSPFLFPLAVYTKAHWNYRSSNISVWSFRAYERMDKSHFTAAEAADFEKTRRYFYESLHLAMEHNPPALIIAAEKPLIPGFWDFPADFTRDPEFARAWSHYSRIGEVTDGWIVLGIYRLRE